MLMVFAVTFAVIILGQLFFFKDRNKQTPNAKPAGATQTTKVAPEAVAPDARHLATAANQPAAAASKSSAVKEVASSEAETVVENSLYRIVFTNLGGQVKSWVLKKYKDEDGHPLDLVNQRAVQFGFPLSLYAPDENLRNQINSALYVASASGNLSIPGQLTYEYSDGGISVRKSFHFDDTYVIAIETEVTQDGKPVPAYPMWPAGFGDQNTGPLYASARIDYMANDKVEQLP